MKVTVNPVVVGTLSKNLEKTFEDILKKVKPNLQFFYPIFFLNNFFVYLKKKIWSGPTSFIYLYLNIYILFDIYADTISST